MRREPRARRRSLRAFGLRQVVDDRGRIALVDGRLAGAKVRVPPLAPWVAMVAYNRKLWDDIERAMPTAAAAMKVEIVSDVDEASFAEAIASARGRQLVSPRAAELAERIAAAP